MVWDRGRLFLSGVALAASLGFASVASAADDTIKVGILHSLSGTMAISETTLKDVMLMLIDEQNKKGGLLDKKLEAVVVDPASDWPLFAEKARELISQDKVVAMLGAYHSSVALTATAAAERQGIPFLVADSVALNITQRGFKWTFRVGPIAPVAWWMPVSR